MKEVFYDWLGYNTEIFHILNNFGNRSILPQLLKYLSWLFNIENFAIYYLLICYFCYWYICKGDKSLKMEAVKNKFWLTYNNLIRIGICYAVFGLTYAALKFSVNLPRPFCSLQPETFKTIINTLDERCMSSFPSSHAGLAFMATWFLWRYFGALTHFCLIVMTCMVAFARITLAMHYPADIIYSYIIVLVVLSISQAVFKLFERNLIRHAGQQILQYLK